MNKDMMKSVDLKKLAYTANIMNTISGGMSVAHKKITKSETGYNLTIDMAGADEHSLSVEIKNQSLFVYQVISQVVEDQQHPIPYVIEWMPIPSEVDFRNIQASFEGRKLHVFLPFNELADGYHKHIDITY